MLTGGWRPRKRVDFCPAITQGAWVAVCEEGVVALPRPLALGRRAALALALGAGALLAVRLDVPAFFDNEARYAEVAREMVLSGDWISPHLDFTLFLNKPPLVFWLAALVFRLAGPTEWARLVSVGAGMVAVGAPWHVATALRHPGFAWDYVVNQHVLFFLARKLPRDSQGDSLAFFWAAAAGRAVPWVLLVPLTLAEAVRGAARRAAPAARGTFLLWAWAGGLLLFFSCAPSRLEHYAIPALPAAALLAARAWQRARAGGLGHAAWVYLLVGGALVAGVGVAGLLAGRALLAQTYWLVQVPGLLALLAPAAAVVAGAGVLAALAALGRRPDWLVAALAASMVPLAAVVLRAEGVAEPLFSWRPAARALVAAVPREVEVVFESPEEYQQVGGLAYYSERRITLLEPPGFVPPSYLAGHTREMFRARAAFERRWRAGERLAFVSDPQRRRDEPAGLVPAPFYLLGRFGDRWVLTSSPAHAG